MTSTLGRAVVGPSVTAATLAAIFLIDRFVVAIPNPAVIYLCAVVFSAYVGGVASGLVSGAMTLVYAVAFFSDPGHLFHFQSDNLKRVAILLVATPAIAVMVGLLQARGLSALARARACRSDVESVNRECRALRAAFDEIHLGVLLLDKNLKARFFNRAMRNVGHVPDQFADSRPALADLLRFGCATGVFPVAERDRDAYIAERLAAIAAGDTTPRELRLGDGEIARVQCAPLPEGGRLLTYTIVTDLIRRNQDLEMLRVALDQVHYGVILLDHELRARFINRTHRRTWDLPEAMADSNPTYAELLDFGSRSRAMAMTPEQRAAFVVEREAQVRAGDVTPYDLHLANGQIIRMQCAPLPAGGRMLSYTNVTEMVHHAEQLEQLATTDAMTGLYNRGHFLQIAEGEWARSARYGRPLSLIMLDIDLFKAINDRFGHNVGDQVIIHVAETCMECIRDADVAARLGGEEFAMLLPETTMEEACAVAERLRREIADHPLLADHTVVEFTVSLGVAEVHSAMSGVAALMKQADEALYQAKRAGRNRVEFAAPAPADHNAAGPPLQPV